LDIGGREGREVGAFGEVLADEAVGVFVQASLPGMIRLGGDVSAKPGCDLSVAVRRAESLQSELRIQSAAKDP